MVPQRFPVDGDSETQVSNSDSSAAPAQAFTPVRTFDPGDLLAGRYEIQAQLGQGGMGAVYKARDRELDRIVALKTISPQFAAQPDALERFKREIILARQISHRNVIRIFDFGESEGTRFITMEFVEGEDLASLLANQGAIPAKEAAEVMLQVFRALAAAHEEGVIHRDLKPANVMRDQHGKVVVMDFGLARTEEASSLTQTGALVGTLAYMSPEQAASGTINARSDIYSAGLIFYELLTGKPAFAAESTVASLLMRSQHRPVPASHVEPSIPRALSDVVSRCLEPDPANRYQNAEEVVRDLETILGKTTTTVIRVLPRRVRQGLWIGSGILVLLLGILAAGIYRWWPNRMPVAHQALTVLVADFRNETGDSVFDGTLEPPLGLAVEGASFVNAFSRDKARNLASKFQPGSTGLDEATAHLIAQREGVNVVLDGTIRRGGNGYQIGVRATDGITGKIITSTNVDTAGKDEVLPAMNRIAARIRRALGDTTPESQQLAAAETFTAASLEAAHEYAEGQRLGFAGNWPEALQRYSKAVELDPNLGRAYVGIANCYYNTAQGQQAEKYYQLALAHIDRMSEREKYRTRGAYYLKTGDADRAVEQQLELVKRYPADNAGLANLAMAYLLRRDMARALEEGRKAVAIYPQNVAQRNNVGLYAMYAGDFDTAIKEQHAVLELNSGFVLAYVGTALSQLGQNQPAAARQTYEQAGKLGTQGASMAASGLADVALYEGRVADAVSLLRTGSASDLAAKDPDGAAVKLVLLAQALLQKGNRAEAMHAADQALQLSKQLSVVFWAARAYLTAGQTAKAMDLAQQLAKRLETDPQAYAKLIEGETQLKQRKPQEALKLFLESRKIADTWMGRFDAAAAYVDAGAFLEAESELDLCQRRRGEATALFLDESPTYHLFPAVYYYLGRAQEGLKSPAAAESYKAFLQIKQNADPDPLVADARRRVR